MSVELETSKLGMAAYLKMKGCTLLGVEPENNTYRFSDDSDKSMGDWELDYMNSCCYRHDNELMHLRRLLRR